MRLAVRRASLTDDRQEMQEILNRNFEPGQEQRFEWRHTANPVGESWTWLLYERDASAAVAMASVFPRQMYIDGKLFLCGQVGDFAVDATHRSLGPAVLLQRATLEPVNAGALAMCYDCPPHDQGMSTFVRLGMSANTQVIRYALPLRSDEFLERKLGAGAWAAPIVTTANLLLRMRRKKSAASGFEVGRFEGRFDEEFSHLDRIVPSFGKVRSSRSAEFLNWRYKDNPDFETRVLVARRAGELVGFLAFSMDRGNAHILDIFGVERLDVVTALVEAAIEISRKDTALSVYGCCSEESELQASFASLGFSRRERAARVVAYEKPGPEIAKLLRPGLRWTFGDAELMT